MENMQNVPSLIKQIHDSIEKRANNEMRPYGITMTQFSTILILRQKPSLSMTLKELEKLLHIAQSTAAGIAARLEANGFIKSYGDKDDKRIKIIGLTQKGLDICVNSEINMKNTEELILRPLTQNEREELRTLLSKVRKTLE